MRPGQNKRMRGRNNNNNNNNRKGPNPLTRSYESNGPDVKIRGTAHHIAEKYLQLARDAQTSGDPVAAESYLQHAEHYFRLIASAQQAQAGYMRPTEEPDPDEMDEDDAVPDRFASPLERPQAQPQPHYAQPQPYAERPYAGERQNNQNAERQPYTNGDRSQFGERQDRQPDRSPYENGRRNDRTGRNPRPYRDQDSRGQDNRGQDNRGQDNRGQENRSQENRGQDSRGQDYHRPQDRTERQGDFRPNDYREARSVDPAPEVNARLEMPQPEMPVEVNGRVAEPVQRQVEPAPRQPEPAVQREPVIHREASPRESAPREPAPAEAPALPAFITAPVRTNVVTPMPESAPEPTPVAAETLADASAEDAPRFPPRRRRRTRAAIAAEAAEAAAAANPVTNE